MKQRYVYQGDIFRISNSIYNEFVDVVYEQNVTINTYAASRVHAINNILYKINRKYTGHGNYRTYYIKCSKVRLDIPEPEPIPVVEVIKPKIEYEQLKLFDGGNLSFYANKH